MQKAVVIADDFTGANDTGVQLKKYGFDTAVIVDSKRISHMKRWDAIVVDTESRSVPKENAYETLSNLSKGIKRDIETEIIYKKVDSTLRGNISIEIKAIMDIMDIDIIVFAPAYPQIGRTTVGGVHFLNGVPVNETELSRDPKNPVDTAVLKDILTEDLDIPCTNVNLANLRYRPQDIAKDVRFPHALIFDADTSEDLKMITQLGILANKRVLWVGSAGLANALFENYRRPQKPVLSVVGSVNSVSIGQYNYVINRNEARGVVVDAIALYKNGKDEIKSVVEKAEGYLSEGENVIISTTNKREDYDRVLQWSRDNSVDIKDISKGLADILGDIVNLLASRHKLSGMFITGGDMAISAIKAMKADGSVVVDEIETGIPHLRILGGPFDGTNLITKAGGFGNTETISHAINYLKNLSM